MIGSLQGIVGAVGEDTALIDVGGAVLAVSHATPISPPFCRTHSCMRNSQTWRRESVRVYRESRQNASR